MKKVTKIFSCILIMVLAITIPGTERAFAYDLDDLGKYIKNPEFFDNQEGRYSNTQSPGYYVDDGKPSYNVQKIYFDKTHKTFQIRLRQYNPDKGVDSNNEVYKWEVIDDSVCTVDQNGFVRAGDTTGATTILAVGERYIVEFAVFNRTGKYPEWYEYMFKNLWCVVCIYDIDDFIDMREARRASDAIGKGYKVVVDAYKKYGDALYNDPAVRLDVIKESVHEAISKSSAKVKYDNKVGYRQFGNCSMNSGATNMMFALFADGTRPQRCAKWNNDIRSHTTNTLLMDGVVYNVDNAVFRKVGVEADGKWEDWFYDEEGNKSIKRSHFDFEYEMFGGTIAVTCTSGHVNPETYDADTVRKKLKGEEIED